MCAGTGSGLSLDFCRLNPAVLACAVCIRLSQVADAELLQTLPSWIEHFMFAMSEEVWGNEKGECAVWGAMSTSHICLVVFARNLLVHTPLTIERY